MSNYEQQRGGGSSGGGGRPAWGGLDITLSDNQKNVVIAIVSMALVFTATILINYYLGGTESGRQALFANMKVYLITWGMFLGVVAAFYALVATTNDANKESRYAKNMQFYPALAVAFAFPYAGIWVASLVIPYLKHIINMNL